MHTLNLPDWIVPTSYRAMLIFIALYQRRTFKNRDDLFLVGAQ